MTHLATKFASFLKKADPYALPDSTDSQQAIFNSLYDKLTSVLRRGKFPYIKYVGDHAVFDEPDNYLVEVDLMPVREDFAGNTEENSPDLSPNQFHHLTQSLIAELGAALPPSQFHIKDIVLDNNLTGKSIQFLIPKV